MMDASRKDVDRKLRKWMKQPCRYLLAIRVVKEDDGAETFEMVAGSKEENVDRDTLIRGLEKAIKNLRDGNAAVKKYD